MTLPTPEDIDAARYFLAGTGWLKPWHQHTTDDDGYCDECGELLPPTNDMNGGTDGE